MDFGSALDECDCGKINFEHWVMSRNNFNVKDLSLDVLKRNRAVVNTPKSKH